MNGWIALITLVALTVVSRSGAAQQKYDLRAVIDQKIAASFDADVAAGTPVTAVTVNAPPSCALQVRRVGTDLRKVEIVPDPGGKCDALWAKEQPGSLNLVVTAGPVKILSLVFAKPPELSAHQLAVKDGKVKVPATVANDGELILFAGAGNARPWIRVPVKEGFFEPAAGDKAEVHAILKGAKVGYYLDDGNGVISHGTMKPASIEGRVVDGAPSPTRLGDMDCVGVAGRRVICVDFLSPKEGPKVTFVPDTGHVIAPNQDVVVRVRHNASQSAKISMAGERGLYVPGARDLSGSEEITGLDGGGAKAPPTAKITQHPFAPRKPGEADISITLSEPGIEDVNAKVELTVDQTYSGAVRLGIGLPFLGAKDASYDVAPAQGSSQPEIVSKTMNGVDLELVVGYSAYTDEGGRSFVRRTCNLCISPFIGVGVWAPEATGVEFLKSLYVGGEWEPTPNFSLGASIVARRVTRMRDGYRVGQAVDGTDVPTRSGIGLGLGLVATFSPDFLRIARPAAQSFLK